MTYFHQIWSALSISIQVSMASTTLAVLPGIFAGLILGLESFRTRDFWVTLLYTSLAFPTVVIGLFVYAFLSRNGPLGELGLLYSRTAIVIGQCVLITPIIATFTLSAIRKLDRDLILTARSLGAGTGRIYLTMIAEARFGIIAAIVAAFGRAVSEVGISMILGGNISGITRTMTTAIALEHDRGAFSEAMILGAILLAISLGINVLFHAFQSPSRTDNA